MKMRWGRVVFAGAAFAAMSVSASAQDLRDPEAGAVIVGATVKAVGEGPGSDEVVNWVFKASFDNNVVKGAPYTAEAVTEFVQTLADGNRITRKTTASVYRDGQGRTRREQSLGAIPPLAAGTETRQHVLINDPVAGMNYILNPQERTAQKLGPPRFFNKRIAPPKHLPAPPPEGALVAPLPPDPLNGMAFGEYRSLPEGKSEPLGNQMLEGLEAEGTRQAVTIAAGAIGNEQPIQIVTERWYAPELQTVVLSRHSDPRFGETTYRLTGIVREEPDHALFEVPPDYQVRDEPPTRDIVIRKFEKTEPRE
jgi:hypothetical protein